MSIVDREPVWVIELQRWVTAAALKCDGDDCPSRIPPEGNTIEWGDFHEANYYLGWVRFGPADMDLCPDCVKRIHGEEVRA